MITLTLTLTRFNFHSNKSKLRRCLPFSKKIRKFRLKVKWNSNFPENPFGNCRQPPEVVLFSRAEQNGGNFPYHLLNFQFPVSHQPKTITGNRIANSKRHFFRFLCWFWKSLYHYLTVVQIGLFWQMRSTQELHYSGSQQVWSLVVFVLLRPSVMYLRRNLGMVT